MARLLSLPQNAAGRIVTELGLGRQAARDEVDGFLRD
jgi:hypothetical protein